MKDIKQKTKDFPVMGLAEEPPFPQIENLPKGWYQKHHWILNDKYIFGIAMVHDFIDNNKLKYSIANKSTGEYCGGKATFKFYESLEKAVKQIEDIFSH